MPVEMPRQPCTRNPAQVQADIVPVRLHDPADMLHHQSHRPLEIKHHLIA
jgi:hypothetical protein